MGKKKRKKTGKCAIFFCCAVDSDSDEDFQEIDDSLTTGDAIKKQPKETSPFQILPGKETGTCDIITKRHPSKEDINSTNTPNQHGGNESSAKPQINQETNRIRPSSTEASTEEMPHNVETLEIVSYQHNSSKPRKKKNTKDDISYDVGTRNNYTISERYAKNDGIPDAHWNETPNFATEEVVQQQPVSIKDIEETESSSNVHNIRIKNLMDTFISTFTNGADRDEVIEDIVDKTDVTDNVDQDHHFAEEHRVQVENISFGDEEENVIPSKDHNAMVDESEPFGKDCNGSDVKTTVSCKVKDEEYNHSKDKYSDIRFAEGGSASPEDTEKIPFNVLGITNNVDKSVASWDGKVEDKSVEGEYKSVEVEYKSVEVEDKSVEVEDTSVEVEYKSVEVEYQSVEVEDTSVEVDPSASSSAECSGESSSPSCDALPDDSQLDSSSDCSMANKIVKANTQRCAGPEEDPPVPKVPMPPNLPPTSDRRTIRRASKPRVVTEDEEETAAASSTRERSSSPPARASDLRGELLQSPQMKFSYESSDSESCDSSHQEIRASKSEGSTKERSTSPPEMRPSDLSEKKIHSPGFKRTSTIGERREEELPVLSEPCDQKVNTFEERSSDPSLFGKNPVLDEKLPNRLGSCSMVLGAIGSQATPEKNPPTKQYHPSPRMLDFTKHLLFSSYQDKCRPGESSSEESIQEKDLDELLSPESKDNLINKKFSRLSQSVFPTSPAIQMKQVDTKPAWLFYNKDFSSKPASTSGFRKEVRPKPAAAAPRTRDLPPPQPREFLLAPSLFGRKPGKDLPPVVGRGPSPGQALHPSSQTINSNSQPIPSTSPTLHPSSKPFLSSTKPFSTCHKPNNASLLPFHQESCSYPSHINSLEPNTIADYEEELYPHTMPFHDHLRSPRLGFMPTFEEDLPPGHFVPTPNSLPNHRYPLGFSPSGFDDDHSPRSHFQKPMNMRLNSNRGGLLKREQSRRH